MSSSSFFLQKCKMGMHRLVWQKHNFVLLCQFLWRGGIGLGRAINKEQKNAAKGLHYLEVFSLDLSTHIPSGLGIKRGREHHKDCLTSITPGHPLRVLIFLAVPGFSETFHWQCGFVAHSDTLALLTAARL